MLNGLRITNSIKSVEFGNVLPSSKLGAPAAYEIRDGCLTTDVIFDVYIDRISDRYYAARRNEFGVCQL